MNGITDKVTSHDVARAAGVSQSSVSRAFTPGSRLSAEKRARVLAAAAALNYVPNSLARSLITRSSDTIAIILGTTDNPFYDAVAHAFMTALQERGKHALIVSVGSGSPNDDAIAQVLRHQVDAVILTASQLSSRSTGLCQARGIPVVQFNRYAPGAEVAVVRCDNAGGGALMAEAMLGAGARRFAVVKGDPMGTTSKDRVHGFIAALREGGIDDDAIAQIEGASRYDPAMAATIARYGDDRASVPDAIFAVNDIMAMGVIDALRGTLGLRVPDDVMVGGFDNIVDGRRWAYRLTTVDQPVARMVAETLALILPKQDAAKQPEPIDRKIAGRLIWRDTVRRPEG